MPKPFMMFTPCPSPCLGCKDRHEGCHGKCEKYLAFKKECEEARKKRLNAYIPSDHKRY